MKHVEVEYIESGVFQGGEEDVFTAGIKGGEACIVVKKKDFELLRAARDALNAEIAKTRGLLLEILEFDERHKTHFSKSFIDRIKEAIL